MSINIQQLQRQLNQIPQATYGTARTLWPYLQDLGDKINSSQSILDWINPWGHGTTSSRMVVERMNVLKEKLFDSSRDPYGHYDDWPGMKQLWIDLAIQFNAVGANASAQSDTFERIPGDVLDSLKEVPETVEDAVQDAAEWAVDIAGGATSGIAKGAAKGIVDSLTDILFGQPELTILLAAGGFVLYKYGGTIMRKANV